MMRSRCSVTEARAWRDGEGWGVRRGRRALGCLVAVFGVVLGLGASVEAQEKTVVLLNLEGRAWRANTRVLKAALSKAADYNLQDQDWFHDRARQRAVSVNDMLDFPDSIVAASDRDGPEGDRVDAIIGPVSATGGEITVEVYNASTGTPPSLRLSSSARMLCSSAARLSTDASCCSCRLSRTRRT